MGQGNTNAVVAVVGLHLVLAFSLAIGIFATKAMENEDVDFSLFVFAMVVSTYSGFSIIISIFGAALASPRCDSMQAGLFTGTVGAVVGSSLTLFVLMVLLNLKSNNPDLEGMIKAFFEVIFIPLAVTNGVGGLGGAYFGRHLGNSERQHY